MVVHRMLRLLLLGLLGAQVLCVKPKWRESGDPRAVTHPSGRHHSYSIHEAAKKGNIDEVHRHIEIHGRKAVHFKDDDGQTPMHLAAIYDQKHIVELLHEMGADIEATNNHHMTPIHYSARSNDVHTLKFLIEKGANIHHTDKFNATALTHAAQKGHEDPAHHLLHAGAKHDHKSWDHVHKVHRTVREWGHHKNRPEISETIDRFLDRAAEL